MTQTICLPLGFKCSVLSHERLIVLLALAIANAEVRQRTLPYI